MYQRWPRAAPLLTGLPYCVYIGAGALLFVWLAGLLWVVLLVWLLVWLGWYYCSYGEARRASP